MGAAVAITRVDLSAGELRKAARKEKDSTAARRILALALVMEGSDRRTAAESCGMDRQTLRDWVHRYNAEGLAGLRSRQATGPRSRLTREQRAGLAALVEAGPDPEQHGGGRGRGGWFGARRLGGVLASNGTMFGWESFGPGSPPAGSGCAPPIRKPMKLLRK